MGSSLYLRATAAPIYTLNARARDHFSTFLHPPKARSWAISLLCTGFLLSGAARADIYKFVDERGVMHVTNIPLSASVRNTANRSMVRSAPLSKLGTGSAIKAAPIRYVEIVDEMARAYRVDAELIHALIPNRVELQRLGGFGCIRGRWG